MWKFSGNKLTRWKRKSAETYLIYNVDESLGIIPREVSDHLNLITIREDCRDQRDALVCGEGVTDQLFPSWDFTVHEVAVELINVESPE